MSIIANRLQTNQQLPQLFRGLDPIELNGLSGNLHTLITYGLNKACGQAVVYALYGSYPKLLAQTRSLNYRTQNANQKEIEPIALIIAGNNAFSQLQISIHKGVDNISVHSSNYSVITTQNLFRRKTRRLQQALQNYLRVSFLNNL